MLGICLCLSIAVHFAVSQEAEAQDPVIYTANTRAESEAWGEVREDSESTATLEDGSPTESHHNDGGLEGEQRAARRQAVEEGRSRSSGAGSATLEQASWGLTGDAGAHPGLNLGKEGHPWANSVNRTIWA
ncbi:hypothetical protein cypCar_00037169 [Cyprinus carpio]|nr:hypothetical protein cypCar_00037169 [Cyprinus carpio]